MHFARSELGPLLQAPLWDPWRFVGEPEWSRRGWGQGRGVGERDSLQRGSGSFSLLALSAVTQEKKPFETVGDAARSYTKPASQTRPLARKQRQAGSETWPWRGALSAQLRVRGHAGHPHRARCLHIRTELSLLTAAQPGLGRPEVQSQQWCSKRCVQGQAPTGTETRCLGPMVLSQAHKNILISFKIRKSKLLR